MFDIEIVEPTAPVVEAPAPATQETTAPVVVPAEVATELAKAQEANAALQAKVDALTPVAPATAEEDYFLNPQAAIDAAVQRGVDAALKARETQAQRITEQAKIVADAHPDAQEVDSSKGFKDFLALNPALSEVYSNARKNLDGKGVANALDIYKKLAKPLPSAAPLPAQELVNVGEGASTPASQGRIFSRTQIQNMIATNPSQYDALAAEITQAYIDGRVTG